MEAPLSATWFAVYGRMAAQATDSQAYDLGK